MCDQVVRPLLDQGAGGRSPGFLLRAKQTLARSWVKLDHPKCPPAGIRDPDTADRNRLAGDRRPRAALIITPDRMREI